MSRADAENAIATGDKEAIARLKKDFENKGYGYVLKDEAVELFAGIARSKRFTIEEAHKAFAGVVRKVE